MLQFGTNMANAILNESLLKPQNTIQCIQLTEISHCTCAQIIFCLNWTEAKSIWLNDLT